MSVAFDLLLMGGLLWLAWRALTDEDLFAGVVCYIAFGLLLALAWVRLRAPDIALAEAAIGSGVTGALFLTGLSRMGMGGRGEPAGRDPGAGWRGLGRGGLGLACGVGLAGLLLLLGWALYEMPRGVGGLGDLVRQSEDEAGVAHEVTAVLLNYRAYDTLLELGVLLIVLAGVWAVAKEGELAGADAQAVQLALVRLLVPVMVVTAGYLLWVGSYAPGGAFQAGAVVAGAGVLLVLGWKRGAWLVESAWMRWGVVAGLAAFLVSGLWALAVGREFLEYGAGHAGRMILMIEGAATLGIGLTLALLFVGLRPSGSGGGGGVGKGGVKR